MHNTPTSCMLIQFARDIMKISALMRDTLVAFTFALRMLYRESSTRSTK